MRPGLSQNCPVRRSYQFGKTFESYTGSRANPGASDDLVGKKCGQLVVDLMPEHNPQGSDLILYRRRGSPMRRRDFLHPTQVDHVIDMPERVYFGWFNCDFHLVRSARVRHFSSMRHRINDSRYCHTELARAIL